MFANPIELERPHLESAIEDILHKPLCVIVAPSGYGKSTIVRKTLEKHPEIKVHWLSLGNSGVDEVWVWRKLCESFLEGNPQLYKNIDCMDLPVTQQDMDFLLTVARQSIFKPVCIVIDDYHECNGGQINKLIEKMVYEEIPNLHILLISRIYPDICCEELFLKGYCSIINHRMLILSKEESKEIFRINHIDLTDQEFHRMHEYTDGWIAAVYLVLYDYMKNGCFEHLSNVGRLLKTVVFDKLSEQMQEVCMKMSLVKSFTLEEACYVTGRKVSMYSLKQIGEHYGFLYYNASEREFVMHTLLRTVAEDELDRREIDKGSIYRRCGEYREKQKQYISAIMCYNEAEAKEEIMKVLSGEDRNLIYQQAPSIIDTILEQLPLEIKMRYPVAYLTYVYTIIFKYDVKKGTRLYREITEACERNLEKGHEYHQLKGELLIIGSISCFNDLKQMNEELGMAYELLDNHVSKIFHHTLLTFGTPFMTVLYYRKPGELKQTIKLEKEYARYHMKVIKGIEGEWDDLFDAEYALMQNDIKTAKILSDRVIERAVFSEKSTCIVVSSYFLQLLSLVYEGNVNKFCDVMEEFRKHMECTVRTTVIVDYELACGYIYSRVGWLDKVPDWLCRFDLALCSRMVRSIRGACAVYGNTLCIMGKWGKLDAIAEQMLIPYENMQHAYIVILGYVFKAIAVYNLGTEEKAYGYLRKAVTIAELDGVTFPFTECGAFLLPMMERLAEESDFCRNLQQQILACQEALKAFDRKEEEHNLLTTREMELMQHVREGLRNSEISEKMHIALVTVEKNLTGIYRKLNVSNRVAAAAKVAELEEHI